MWYKKLNIRNIGLLLFLCVILQFCVPMKRQILLQDKSKKTLRALQMVDTMLLMPSFEYKLKSKDIISINFMSLVKGEYDLSTLSQQGNISSNGGQMGGINGQNIGNSGYIIDDNGEIYLPMLGKIKVSGLNVEQATKEIQKVVDKYLDNMVVNIKMLNFYVILMGEITTQGRISAEGNSLTLVEAIAIAGGFKEFANRNKIKIIRRDLLNTHIFYVDATDQNILTLNQIYLMPNDIIMIEPLRVKNMRTYSLPNITLIVSSLALAVTLLFTFRNIFSR